MSDAELALYKHRQRMIQEGERYSDEKIGYFLIPMALATFVAGAMFGYVQGVNAVIGPYENQTSRIVNLSQATRLENFERDLIKRGNESYLASKDSLTTSGFERDSAQIPSQ